MLTDIPQLQPLTTPNSSSYLTLHNHQSKIFSTFKVPLAQKTTVQQYRQRATIVHPNVPLLVLDNSSPFYLTVHVEIVELLTTRDLLSLPLPCQIQLLLSLLKGVDQLSYRYGFFEVQEGMVGERKTGGDLGQGGRVSVWISDDLKDNSRKFPIEKGRFSQETFVSSFKATFMKHLQRQREFNSARSIHSLVEELEQRQHCQQSLQISPFSSKFLSTKGSLAGLTSFKHSQLSVEQWREKAKANNQKGQSLRFSRHVLEKGHSVLGSYARRGMSTSYLEPGLQWGARKLKRTNTEGGRLNPFNHSTLPITPELSSPSEEETRRRQLTQSTNDHQFGRRSAEGQSWLQTESVLHDLSTTKQSIDLGSQIYLSRMRWMGELQGNEGEGSKMKEIRDMEMELDCLFSEGGSERSCCYDEEGLQRQFDYLLDS